jgi:DNA-binding response OmpR family regulator
MSSGLRGLTFLVVDDEPLIAMDIAMALEDVGAKVTTTNTLKDAVLLAEHDGLAGAIVDHSLGDGDSTVLRGRLKERGIPFLVYSGFEVEGEPYLSKPATPDQLVGRLSQTCPEPDLVCGST